MKILCITSSYPVHPRLKKIGDSFRHLNKASDNINTKYIAWDRLSISKNNDNFIFKSREGYGNKYKKLLGLLKFSFFLRKKIQQFKPDIIVCRYVDMALLGVFLKVRQS